MNRRARAGVVVLCWLSISVARAQQPLDFAPLEQVAREELQQERAPGATVAVVVGDRVVFAKALGLANVETEEPLRPDMLFRLGSTTKMFTAAALVALAEEGKLGVHQPIGRYVQGLAPTISQLTAHQLLSHRSGLLDEAPMFGSHDDEALGREVRSWKDDHFFTEPGEVYSYSNPAYWLAGFVVESVSGNPFADQVASTIFAPLGMARSTFRPTVAMTYPLAQGHDLDGDQLKVIRPAANNSASWPAGSIFSNVLDLSRWVIAFVNGGRIDGTQIIPASVIAMLQTPASDIPGSTNKYGYGLQLGTWRGVRVVQHNGSRSGYGSVIRMVPEHRFGVMVLANRSGASLNRTAETAMEIALPLAPADSPRPRSVVAMTAAEMKRYVGGYSQGRRTLEILERDGKLVLRQGDRESVLEKTGDRELSAGSTRYVIVTGSAGAVDYLHSGGRSWRKL